MCNYLFPYKSKSGQLCSPVSSPWRFSHQAATSETSREKCPIFLQSVPSFGLMWKSKGRPRFTHDGHRGKGLYPVQHTDVRAYAPAPTARLECLQENGGREEGRELLVKEAMGKKLHLHYVLCSALAGEHRPCILGDFVFHVVWCENDHVSYV